MGILFKTYWHWHNTLIGLAVPSVLLHLLIHRHPVFNRLYAKDRL